VKRKGKENVRNKIVPVEIDPLILDYHVGICSEELCSLSINSEVSVQKEAKVSLV